MFHIVYNLSYTAASYYMVPDRRHKNNILKIKFLEIWKKCDKMKSNSITLKTSL